MRRLLAKKMKNSLCKTLGHEIGHVLNLTHHKKKVSKYLMVGGSGTEMKKKEVERSLKTAEKILK